MIKRLILFSFLFIYNFSVFSQLYFNEISSSVDFNHTYFQGVSGAGVSFVDFDNDGLDDISIPTNDYNVLLFFKNNGDKFSSIDLKINFPYQAKQVLWIDYDNDYDKDLYITSFNGKNKLYQNNGFMNFEDVTKKLNLPDSSSNSFGASWADINNDGFIDLFQTYRSQDSVSNVSKVFLNISGVSFQDITSSSGIKEINKLPFCATFVDIDNDNIQDLYIANDKASGNSMYYNTVSYTHLTLPTKA